MDAAIRAQYSRAHHFVFNHAFLTWDGLNMQDKEAGENPFLEHDQTLFKPPLQSQDLNCPERRSSIAFNQNP
jgi:hypothetical protein